MKSVSVLVTEAQMGSLEAFELLVKQFQDMVYTVAFVRLEDKFLAEDAAQEGLIEAFLHIKSLREPAAFGGWLRRIVLRQCNRIQRGKTVETVPLENALNLSGHSPDPFDVMIGHETSHVVRDAMNALPEQDRTAMLLHYISGYSQHQIAEFLEVPATTLRKRLQSARERLKEKFMTMDEDYFERKPSKDEAFSKRVRFFIAVRTSNANDVKRLLRTDSSLAEATERWSETLAQLYPRAQPTEKDKNAFKEQERKGWTPLYWATLHGNTEITQLLIDYGAKIDDIDWRGVSLVSIAVERGDLELVSLFIKNGANPDSPQSYQGLLHIATATGQAEIAKLLLNHGANINRLDRFGRTALHWAAITGHRDLLSLLVEHGADATMEDHNGQTALWWAKHSGHADVVQILEDLTQ